MDKYIVSARKYRPNNFSTLVGQENIAVTLKNSIKRGQLAHAYLFCGPRGVGKTSTARIFAKTINCMNPSEDLEPCGVCESCLSFKEGRSYCIHELDAASNNSVDDIRLLTEKVRIPPQIGKYSVYIIDEVHMLSASAFNAFLKTLEEPPEHAIFILATTEKHKILPTILSRCQTYDFNRISIEDIVKNLTDIADKEGIVIDSESMHVIAQKADGAMRDALTLFDQCVAFCGTDIKYSDVIKNLNVLDYEYYFRLIDYSLEGDFSKSLLLFDDVLNKGFNALYFVGGLSTHLRNLMVAKSSSTSKLLELSPGLIEKYSNQASKCSLRFIFKALEYTTSCEGDYKLSGNPRLLVEFMLIKFASLSPKSEIAEGVGNIVQGGGSAGGSGNAGAGGGAGNAGASGKNVSSGGNTGGAGSSANGNAGAGGSRNESVNSGAGGDSAGGSKGNESADDDVKGKNNLSGGGLSIKNILSKATAAQQDLKEKGQEKTSDNTENKAIEQADVERVWLQLANEPGNQERLVNALKRMDPHILDDGTTIEFFVENAPQKIWMEKNKIVYFTSVMQKELSNSLIKLSVKIREVEQQEKKLYMPQEKAKYMLENNPELVKLSKDLDLEIK